MSGSNNFNSSNPSDIINRYIITEFNKKYETIGHTHPDCSVGNCILFATFYFTVSEKFAKRTVRKEEATATATKTL